MITLLENIRFHLSINILWFVIAALLAVLFTIYIYRRTNPIVSNGVRISLIVLRSLVLLLTLLIVLQATLMFLFEKKNKPILAVAIDNSASMAVSDAEGSRIKVVTDVLKSDNLAELEKKFDIKTYIFDASARRINIQQDSLLFNGDETNISASLEEIKADNILENLSAILLISDGVYNAGGNPERTAEALNVPVHTVRVGSPEPVKDLAIIKVESNPFSYVDKETPIKITVHNTAFDPRTLPVAILQDGRQVATKNLNIPLPPADATVTIPFKASKPGRKKLVLKIPAAEGEQTVDNNQRTIYIDVLKSKISIALVAGSLSPDISFLRRLLTTERYQVDLYNEKKTGVFYDSRTLNSLNKADIIILYDYPSTSTPEASLSQLVSIIEKKKLPLLIIPGKRSSARALAQLKDFAPFESLVRLPVEEEISLHIAPMGETHSIMRVAEDATVSRSLWNELPPIYTINHAQNLAADAQVLAYSRSSKNSRKAFPLIILRSADGHKSAALIGYAFWRWDLMMRGIGRDEEVYRTFLINLVQWLETKRSNSLIQIEMENANYGFGEPVRMDIQVFDEKQTPVTGAELTIAMKSDGNTDIISAEERGEGKYAATFQPPRPGDYTATVTAQKDGRNIGEESILFSVGEYSAELADLQAQQQVLTALARATGGIATTVDSLSLITNSISGKTTVTPLTIESELWNNKLILILIIGLLTAEWFIRKRKGML